MATVFAFLVINLIDVLVLSKCQAHRNAMMLAIQETWKYRLSLSFARVSVAYSPVARLSKLLL